jgi:hypothetical protein
MRFNLFFLMLLEMMLSPLWAEEDISHLQGWDVSASKMVLINAKPIVRPLESAEDLDVHLKIMHGEKVTAHIDELPYLYEWINENGTRFFSKERPNWYANPLYPSDRETRPIRVYGEYEDRVYRILILSESEFTDTRIFKIDACKSFIFSRFFIL